jgi:hypothetical protein
MTTKQKIQKLVAGLKYNTGFEDVSNEPSYVVDELMKIVEETYSQAITDAVSRVATWDISDYMIEEIITDLEALKK